MTNYIPGGYIAIQNALIEALMHWHASDIEVIAAEKLKMDDIYIKKNKLDPIASIIYSGVIPTYLSDFADKSPENRSLLAVMNDQRMDRLFNETRQRFRDLLYSGQLVAEYMSELNAQDGPVVIPRADWATAALDGAMETGKYWPQGIPPDIFSKRPSVQLLIKRSRFESVIKSDDLEVDMQSPEQSSDNKKVRGRPPGTGLADHDRSLFPQIDELLKSGKVANVQSAVTTLDKEGKVLGAEKARIRRLSERYKKERKRRR